VPELNKQPVVADIGLFGDQRRCVHDGVVDYDAWLWRFRVSRACCASGNKTERINAVISNFVINAPAYVVCLFSPIQFDMLFCRWQVE
jgi:hypothetical protein